MDEYGSEFLKSVDRYGLAKNLNPDGFENGMEGDQSGVYGRFVYDKLDFKFKFNTQCIMFLET